VSGRAWLIVLAVTFALIVLALALPPGAGFVVALLALALVCGSALVDEGKRDS
jgi:hypothetical protein